MNDDNDRIAQIEAELAALKDKKAADKIGVGQLNGSPEPLLEGEARLAFGNLSGEGQAMARKFAAAGYPKAARALEQWLNGDAKAEDLPGDTLTRLSEAVRGHVGLCAVSNKLIHTRPAVRRVITPTAKSEPVKRDPNFKPPVAGVPTQYGYGTLEEQAAHYAKQRDVIGTNRGDGSPRHKPNEQPAPARV